MAEPDMPNEPKLEKDFQKPFPVDKLELKPESKYGPPEGIPFEQKRQLEPKPPLPDIITKPVMPEPMAGPRPEEFAPSPEGEVQGAKIKKPSTIINGVIKWYPVKGQVKGVKTSKYQFNIFKSPAWQFIPYLGKLIGKPWEYVIK